MGLSAVRRRTTASNNTHSGRSAVRSSCSVDLEWQKQRVRRSLGVDRRAILTLQYQATSITYRADRRATHAPNNSWVDRYLYKSPFLPIWVIAAFITWTFRALNATSPTFLAGHLTLSTCNQGAFRPGRRCGPTRLPTRDR